jgi:hypothetical protein
LLLSCTGVRALAHHRIDATPGPDSSRMAQVP